MATLQMESQLRKAVQEHALKLVYQPILKLPEHTLTAVEVFVRWPQPEADWVPPSEFLPLAEETGLILPLGRWVMHEACSTMDSWAEQGRIPQNLQLNINLSARQFRQPNLVTEWQNALAKWPRLKMDSA